MKKNEIKIAIRDDDLCYWSNYEEFISFYHELDIPVSASVTPFAVANHGDAFHFGDFPRDVEKNILENTDLVENLKNDVASRKVEILLHGYSHQYKKTEGLWETEMIWNDYQTLFLKLKKGKELLETEFKQKIDIFVAPSQVIDKKGIDIISKLNMNFSGMISRLSERKFSFKSLIYLLRRYLNRLKYGIPIQGLMKYSSPFHSELGIVPLSSFDELVRLYKIFKRKHWNMVIVTHYWQLQQNIEKAKNLEEFVNFVGKDKFTMVSDCFKE